MASRIRMPRCAHCGKAMVTCISRRPPLNCPPACRGWRHRDGKHRCSPREDTTYAEPGGAGDG